MDVSTEQDSVMRRGWGGGWSLLLGLGMSSTSLELLDYRFPCLAL